MNSAQHVKPTAFHNSTMAQPVYSLFHLCIVFTDTPEQTISVLGCGDVNDSLTMIVDEILVFVAFSVN